MGAIRKSNREDHKEYDSEGSIDGIRDSNLGNMWENMGRVI